MFGYFSLFIKDKIFLSEPFLATLFGVAIGPVWGGLFDANLTFGVENTTKIILEVSRLILGIQCLAAGVQSPGNFVFRQRVSLAMLLGPVMAVTIKSDSS